MNSNEFTRDGRVFVRSISKCRCLEKKGDAYIMECKIAQRGKKDYRYIPGTHYISRASYTQEGRGLWLTDDSELQLERSVGEFDAVIEKANAHGWGYSMDNSPCEVFALYYEPVPDFLYNFLIKYSEDGDHICYSYLRSMTVNDIIRDVTALAHSEGAAYELLQNRTADSIAKNPIYIAAVNGGDMTLRNLIKLNYRIADYDECRYLSETTGRRILPPLPEGFNRTFAVDSSTVSAELLIDSGYSILHRQCISMRSEFTYTKWQLNPHTKMGRDFAQRDAETISFDEFVRMIEGYYEREGGAVG